MHPLITAPWLASRLGNPELAILDATLPPVGVTEPIDTHGQYLAAHIPGAVFFDIDDLSDQTTTLPHMLPDPLTFSRKMSSLGISDSMTIVVYEQAGVFSAARARWMLRVFGAQHVYVLDGGFSAWREAGLPVESGVVQPTTGNFSACLTTGMVKNLSDIQEIISNGGQILDARSFSRFNGSSPEPRPGIPSGHMPGAINIPFTELLDGNRLKSVEELRNIFAARNVNLTKPITTTCGSGVTAAVLDLGLEIAGAIDSGLYDGSWAEYARQPSVLIETTR